MVVDFLPLFKDVETPAYATIGSAGCDLIAHNFKKQYRAGNTPEELSPETSGIILHPGDRALIGTGFAVAIPKGWEMQIRPRSGNSLKSGLGVLNSPGTIDSDYRGEVGVIIINHSTDAVTIKKGDKIAQAIVTEYDVVVFRTVDELPETDRGHGGYGSTGK